MNDDRRLNLINDAVDACGALITDVHSRGKAIPTWLNDARNQLTVEYEVLAAAISGREPMLLPGERGTL